MKLKNTNKLALRALAVTVTLAAAHAAVINVPPNYTTAVGTFADTIQANAGGTSVVVVAGSTLTGNAVGSSALSINAGGYVVGNSGNLTGNITAAGVAVSATTGTTVINNLPTGRMSSVAAQGISIGTLVVGVTVNNNGIVQGGDDGIKTLSNGLTIVNTASGQISGITGLASDGIQASDALTLTNSGIVQGAIMGVNAGNTASITNALGANGSITGTTRGVSGIAGLTVINNGTITATAATGIGVAATGANATITNGVACSIFGGNDAVQVLTGAIIINDGTIRSTAAAATATNDGIQLTDGTITNTSNGTITGADRGIRYAGVGTVINSGTISGMVGIDFAGATADTLTMTGGTITGTGTTAGNIGAVLFGAGNDVLNLQGGTITGIVDGNAGSDAINFSGGTATINGNVTGFETIVRNGTAATVATINGTTATDFITVTAGSLYLNGNVTPSSVGNTAVTLNGGVLGGTGIWNVVVNQSAGMLSPGSASLAIGNLTVGSDVIGTKLSVTGGNLLINVNSSTLIQANDLLTVSNNVNITGAATILISPTTLNAPLQNGNTRVLDTVGIRTGQYAAANFFLEAGRSDGGPLDAGTTPGLFTSSTVSLLVTSGTAPLLDVNDTYVTVVHNYANAALPLTSFGQQFGTALNGMVPASLADPVLADFLGYLDYSNAATVAGVINAYEPTDFQASLAYSVVSSREIHRIVEQQNLGDRMFQSGTHVWANYNYNDYSSVGSSSRYTVGIGSAIDTFHFGALVSYGNSDISSNSKIESLAYGAYMGMGTTTGWQVNGYIGGSDNKTTTSRGGLGDFKPDGNGFQALLSSAYMMEQGSCTWGPTFGVEYTNASLDGNASPGGALPGMSYSSDTLESLRSLLGLRAEFNMGSKIHPYLSAQWAHEFDGTSNGYTATFQGNSFNVNSPINLTSDSFILRAGLIVGFSDTVFGDIGYLGEYSTSGDSTDYNGLNVGLHASF